jgi:hypothetical protein
LVTYWFAVEQPGQSVVEFGPEQAERRHSAHWTLFPHMLPPGVCELRYTLCAWGHFGFDWRVRMKLRQKRLSDGGDWSLGASWTEGGVLDETGNSEMRTGRFALPLVAISAAGAGAGRASNGAD